ncbi:MAG TPA: TlpA disulfide reductase family protein [Candidatus Limnocylindrales bacterium]
MGTGVRGASALGGRLRTVLVVVVTVVAIGLVAFVIDQPTASGVTNLKLSGAVAGAPPQVGQVPPDFTAMTADGKTVRLSDLKGKPVWLNFGATWCQDCRSEVPDVEAAWQKYQGQGLVLVAVYQDDAASAADYVRRVGITYRMAVDADTAIASRYDILGIPTHVFIGRDGTVKAFRIGGLKPDDIDRYVQDVLR